MTDVAELSTGNGHKTEDNDRSFHLVSLRRQGKMKWVEEKLKMAQRNKTSYPITPDHHDERSSMRTQLSFLECFMVFIALVS